MMRNNIIIILLCAALGFPPPVLARCNTRPRVAHQRTLLKKQSHCISCRTISLQSSTGFGQCVCSKSILSAKKEGLVTKKIKDGFSRVNSEIKDKILLYSDHNSLSEWILSKKSFVQSNINIMYCVWLK